MIFEFFRVVQVDVNPRLFNPALPILVLHLSPEDNKHIFSPFTGQVFNSSKVGDMSSALMQCCADLQTIKDYTSSMMSRLQSVIDLL